MNFLQNFSRAFIAARNSIFAQKRTILSVPNDASNFSRKIFMEEIAKEIDRKIWENSDDLGSFVDQTKEEIEDGLWLKGRICDIAGNVVFDGPISKKLKDSLLKKSLFLDDKKSADGFLSNIKFDKTANEKSDLVFINVGKKLVPSSQEDVLTFEFDEIEKTDLRDVKRIAVQKFLHQSESGISKPDKDIRLVMALVSELQFDLNLKQEKLSIPNLEEVRQKHVDKEAGFDNEEEREKATFWFNYEVNDAVKAILSKLSYIKDESGKTVNLYEIDHKKEFNENDPIIAECLNRAKPKIYRTSVENNKVGESEDLSTHLVNSPLRNEDSLIYGGYIVNKSEYKTNFAHSFLVNAVLENAAEESYGKDFNKFFKQMNYSPVVGSVAFPRDYSVYFDGAFHQTDQQIAKAISDEESPSYKKKRSSSHLDRLDSHRADLRSAGYDVERDIPFDAKGGNMIFTKNSAGEKVLIATVSDSYFADDGEFRGGYVLDKNNQLKEWSNSSFWSFISGDKYPKFRQQIIDWGKEKAGCDHVVVLDRNISAPDRDKFKSLYHLDVFCGALPGGDVLIHPESVTQNNMAELKQVFGEDKITEISSEEKNEICANFVTLGKMVVMSSPKTPQSFIEKINNLGFDVYVPSIYLSKDETLREGWPAGIRCLTSSTDGFEKTAEITDVKIQMQNDDKSSPKGIVPSHSLRLVEQSKTKNR